MGLKRLLFIGYISCLFAACTKNAAYQVDVKLSNLEAQHVYAVFEAFDGKDVDTIACQPSETISIIRKEGEYTTLTVYFENHKDWITVYLEPYKKITITGDALYPQLVQVKGTRTNELLSDFRKKGASLLKEKTELSGAIDTALYDGADHAMAEHTPRLANIDHELTMLAEHFIRKHPHDEASAVLIQEYFLDPENPFPAETLINTLDPKLDDSSIVKNLKAYCQKANHGRSKGSRFRDNKHLRHHLYATFACRQVLPARLHGHVVRHVPDRKHDAGPNCEDCPPGSTRNHACQPRRRPAKGTPFHQKPDDTLEHLYRLGRTSHPLVGSLQHQFTTPLLRT